jgi:hypothetical protein
LSDQKLSLPEQFSQATGSLHQLRDENKMETDEKDFQVVKEPWYTLGAGLLPFVLLGAMAVLLEIPREWGDANSIMKLAGLGMFGGYLLILAGLLVGALAGFPRWVFPYLVYGFFFAFYISNASTPGLVVLNIEMWGRELWGWRALVPLGLVILLVPILKRHPGRLMGSFWSGMEKDWSRVAFGFYGLFPFLMLLIFDEMDHAYSFPGAVIGAIIFLVGAVLYLSLKSPFWRTFAMLAFAFTGVLAVNATTHLYWDTHDVNLTTGASRLLEGPIPYMGILVKSFKGAIATTLFLLIPGAGKILGFIENSVEAAMNRLPKSS